MKKILIALSLIPVFLGIGFIFISYSKANPTPYPEAKADVPVPTYNQVNLAYSHNYDGDNYLPVTGAAIIDVNNDGVPEVFLGGGPAQDDVLFGFADGSFKKLDGLMFKKSSDDVTYDM